MKANTITSTTPRPHAAVGLSACTAVLLLLCGCHKAAPSAPNKDATASPEATAGSGKPAKDNDEPKKKPESKSGSATAEASEEGRVVLKPEEIGKMGILTTGAHAIARAPEVVGFGVVIAHETIAQAVAELQTAAAAQRQSRSALERTKRLAGTPGAMPAETQEAAQRQAAADRAALELARQRLSSTFGQNPPWKTPDDSAELLALASGRTRLVRVTFPLGTIGEETPDSVRLAHIEASQTAQSWQSASVWRAPADSSVPGRSFFAILKGHEAAEGDHLMAWAPVGAPESGVLVPAAAAVISAGKFWCYIEKQPGTFVRTEFDPGRPVPEGYFVKMGISPGDRIVTASAGQLLARETNPSAEPE